MTTKRKLATVNFHLIRQWIKELRAARKISLAELAERTGYSTQYLADIELGTRHLDITNLFIVLDGLECDLVLRKRKPQRTLFTFTPEQLDGVTTGRKSTKKAKGN